MSDPGGPPERGSRVGVVIPAAGSGERMGGRRKPWLLLAGEPLLLHALRPFLARPDVVGVAVALSVPDLAEPPPWLSALDPRLLVVAGGTTRTASVRAGLAALPADLDLLVVHDAARPLLSRELLDRCLEAARRGQGAVAGRRIVDTVKEVDRAGKVVGTPDRSRLWRAETPQAFPASVLRAAYAQEDEEATDDSALVERAGGTVVMVEGSADNLKVTTPDDLLLAERLLELSRGR